MRIFLLLCAMTIMLGCASTGRRIDRVKASEIKEGVTTRGEVLELLGNPYGTSLTDDGKEKLNYVFVRMNTKARNFIPFIGLFIGGADTEKETLQILIGKDGKVEKQSYNKANEEVKLGLFA